MQIEVEKVLTEDEFSGLFISGDNNSPGFVDGNEDEWITYFYKCGYRLVKLEDRK